MAQNMNVAVTLRLVDQFTNNVRAFQQQLQNLTQGVQAFNRAAGGAGGTNPFARMQGQVRGLANDVRTLAGSFSQLSRSTMLPSGGNFGSRQVADRGR